MSLWTSVNPPFRVLNRTRTGPFELHCTVSDFTGPTVNIAGPAPARLLDHIRMTPVPLEIGHDHTALAYGAKGKTEAIDQSCFGEAVVPPFREADFLWGMNGMEPQAVLPQRRTTHLLSL